MKNLSRESILRMVGTNTSNTTTTENVITENRSRGTGTQEQTRKGPDMETRLKELEELTAKMEDRVAKLESLHNQR